MFKFTKNKPCAKKFFHHSPTMPFEAFPIVKGCQRDTPFTFPVMSPWDFIRVGRYYLFSDTSNAHSAGYYGRGVFLHLCEVFDEWLKVARIGVVHSIGGQMIPFVCCSNEKRVEMHSSVCRLWVHSFRMTVAERKAMSRYDNRASKRPVIKLVVEGQARYFSAWLKTGKISSVLVKRPRRASNLRK